jgi:peroxiredoxin
MRLLACLLFSLFTALSANAQRLQLNEQSVVKDSSGTVYPYAIWTKLVMKGYQVKAVDPKDKNTEFLLIRLSEKDLETRFTKMKPRESEYFTTGKKFNGFKARDLEGKKHDLNKLEGKILVMNFWFVDCPPCRQEIPDLNDIVDSFRTNKKVVFVAVALDDAQRLRNFLEQSPFKYDMISDGRSISGMYGVKSYPTHLIVDQQGKVYFHSSGLSPSTAFWIKKTITELLEKEKEVAAVPSEK